MRNEKLIFVRSTGFISLVFCAFLVFFSYGEALAARCSNCGNSIYDSSVFCMYCGVKVNEKVDSRALIAREKLNVDLFKAAARGDLNRVRLLIDSGADIESRDYNGDTVLEKAAGKGDLDIIKYLCDKGVRVDNLNNGNWTPLMSACDHGNYEAAEYLIERGAKVDQAALMGIYGERTPLMQAAYKGHADIVKLLVEKGANPDFANIKGETALGLAKSKFNMKAASILESSLKNSEAGGAQAVDIEQIKSVYEKDGVIYLSFMDGEPEKITGIERCKYPALSRDKKYLCFVRTFPQLTLGMACGEIEVTDLYMADLTRSTKPFLILEGSRKHLLNIYEINAGINSPQFSPDGMKIYYMCAALLLNNAIKVIDLRSKEVRFLTGGNSLRVIYEGKYKDHFISLQHKYSSEKFPRDVYCLMGPDGIEIREVSTDAADVEKEFFNQDK